jgi:ATP-binding cassette subfamily C protein
MLNKTNLRYLREAFKQFYFFAPRRQTLIFILMLLQGMTAGIGLLFIIPLLQLIGFDMGQSVNNGIANAAQQIFAFLNIDIKLENILLSYVIIISIIATLRYRLSVMSSAVQQTYITFLRTRLYNALLNTHWQFIVQNKMSDFNHCLSAQVQAIGHASHLMLTFLNQSVLALIMLALTFLLSWQMTLLAMFFALLLLLVLRPFNRMLYRSGHAELTNYKTIFQMLGEQLGSLKMIKSYASEARHAEQIAQTSLQLETQQLKLTRITAMTQWVFMVASVISFSLFFYVALQLLSIPLATIFLLLVVYSRLLPQISGLQRTYQQLTHKLPAFKDVWDMQRHCEDNREHSAPAQESPLLMREIRLEAVQYCYPNKTRPVFDRLSLTIAKNQTSALVGESGAGKSTLADLIAGLIPPTAGHIYCDDTLLNDQQRLNWRGKIAYVTQEVYLFHDSVRANLSWVAKQSPDDAKLWEALEHAAAAQFVAKLPNGLDTVIGDRGIRLSGGERQRLALARALLAEPQVLILDEATSALDRKNEQHLQKAIDNFHGKLTIIIISHRLSTLEHADKVVLLDNGEIRQFDGMREFRQFYDRHTH